MLKPGMIISDRYEIIDNVGSGGMADVYKAKDQRLNRFVAIKVLKPEYSSDKSFVNKFRGEAQSAAGLSHPNIVNVYDVGDDGGLHYIVMELVEGITLKRFIERKGKLEVKEAIGIAIQIAQGMEAAHDNHIIHRDIKPQNIIISREGKVKVTDFGIAKATNSNTITSNAMGSVHYLSPEQARGGYSDEKSDIYSLGVTMYEMLSGKVPFAGDNTVSVALLHIQGEAMPLREIDPNIPISVDKIVQKCMQKRPERRYHSASELIMDLKRSITNPDGDFVQIPAFVASDSPTINISDDLSKIKNSAYIDSGMRDTKKDLKADVLDDDEELDTVDPKVEKFFTVGSIVIIVILALAIIFTVLFFVLPRDKKGNTGNTKPSVSAAPSEAPSESPTAGAADTVETYKFPNVLGRTKTDAEEIIKAKDPKANISWKENYSDDYKKGTVMLQYPDADRDATVGSDDIIITISVGPQSFTIPYVYGLDEDKATRKLEDYKLKPKVDFEASETIPEGMVTRTDPAKDSLVVAGDTVTLWISTGPANTQATVPLLTGKTLEAAKKLLADAGLTLGTVTPETSDTEEKGKITYQSTTANEKIAKGSAIDISISTGPASAETGGDTVKYTGEVNIDINPFETLGGTKGLIELYMVQDGSDSTPIYEQKTSSGEFPITFSVESESNATGTVTMFVDGKPFKLQGETDAHTWTVNFKPEE